MGLHMSTAHKKSDPTTRRIQGSMTSLLKHSVAQPAKNRFLLKRFKLDLSMSWQKIRPNFRKQTVSKIDTQFTLLI